MSTYYCENIDNFRFCEINGIINIGNDVIGVKYSGLINDVYGKLKIPEKITFKGEERTVQILSTSAFAYSSITIAYIPYTITDIKRDAFINCIKLKEVVIPENTQIKFIGQGSFYYLLSMKRFWLPSSVTNIDANAFGYMNDKDFYYCGTTNFNLDIFEITRLKPPKIHVSPQYEENEFGQVPVTDHSFNCYSSLYYQLIHSNNSNEIPIHFNCIFIFLLTK